MTAIEQGSHQSEIVFSGTSPTSGAQFHYFFDFHDWLNAIQFQTSPYPIFLALGDSYSEWQLRTQNLARRLHLGLLESGIELLLTHTEAPLSKRQFAVAFGHLSAAICQMASKIYLQAEMSLELNPNHDFDDRITFEFQVPDSTSNSLELLRDESCVRFFEQCLLSLAMKRKSSFTISPSSSNVLTQAPERRLWHFPYLYLQRKFAAAGLTSNYVIAGTYLGRVREAILSVSLGNLPSFTELKPPKKALSVSREECRGTLTSIDNFVQEVFRAIAPVALVEGFEQTRLQAEEIGFISDARLFFTSSEFADDFYRSALVAGIAKGAISVIGQHGNIYGSHLLDDFYPEVSESDVFIRWGKKLTRINETSIGVLKPEFRQRRRKVVKRVVLFLPDDFKSSFFADRHQLISKCIERTIHAVEVCQKLGLDVTVRFHPEFPGWARSRIMQSTLSRSKVTFDSGSRRYIKFFSGKYILFFLYDSTGMLQCASQGVPFFAFFDDKIETIREEFRAHYSSLIHAGLLVQDRAQLEDKFGEFIKAFNSKKSHEFVKTAKFFNGDLSFGSRSTLRELRKLLKNLSKKSK